MFVPSICPKERLQSRFVDKPNLEQFIPGQQTREIRWPMLHNGRDNHPTALSLETRTDAASIVTGFKRGDARAPLGLLFVLTRPGVTVTLLVQALQRHDISARGMGSIPHSPRQTPHPSANGRLQS